MKRKRVGAGFRGSSTVFQTASEILKTSINETLTAAATSQESADFEEESQEEEKPETKRSKPSPSASLSSDSPSKRSGKALSKKQQKLAEAAKKSHCISQYFGKKMTDNTPKNGEATVLEPEETGVFVKTPLDHNFVSGTNSTESQHKGSMHMTNNDKNARPVKNQTPSTTAMEMCRTEEATQGFEGRTLLEADGYDHVTPLLFFSGFPLSLQNF